MLRSFGHYSAITILVLSITSVGAFSQSNSAAPIPAAPIPVQMINGKNVFIANLTGEDDMVMSVTEQPYYNAFYAAVKNSGRYHLVSTPEEADLVFQLRTIKGGVELTVIDPHSNIALWSISHEVVIGGSLSAVPKKPASVSAALAAVQKDLASASAALAVDLQKLIASAPPGK